MCLDIGKNSPVDLFKLSNEWIKIGGTIFPQKTLCNIIFENPNEKNKSHMN
jgi:hypothetical protein